ncbi:MAG: CD1247 N-terminal domain-containing protein [Eubacteriales bacterium]
MKLSEKAAYLKGLTDGLGLDLSASNGRVLNEVVGLLQEIAKSIDSLREELDTAKLSIDELDEDLGAVEDIVYEIDEDEDEDMEDMFELACPKCGEIIVVDDSLDPSAIKCPSCGEEFDAICDCGCCHHEDDEDDEEEFITE